MSEPLKLGPFPLGVNNVDGLRAGAFQIPSQPGDKPPMLREAINVDLDRNGFLARRAGRTKLRTLVDGHSGASIGGMILVVSGGNLCRVDPASFVLTTLVSGIGSNEVSYVEVAGEVFWSNGQQSGRIQAGAPVFWGLRATDPPILSSLSGGALREGHYLVAVTGERDGVESGVRRASEIDLTTSSGGIAVTVTGDLSQYETLNVYCSDTNGRELYWVNSVVAGDPIVITGTNVSTDLCDSLGVYPPPAGQIVREFHGRLLVASGDTLYWSEPLGYHRFHLATDLQMFPSRIVLLEPTVDGFFVAVEGRGTWFVQGDDPETWRPREISDCPACEGAAVRIPGHKLSWVQTDEMVLVWATRDGWAAGLPGGTIKYPTSGRIAMDTNTKATLAFREQGSLRQILLSARDKTAVTRYGTSDRVTARVYKADGTIQ